MASGSGSRKRMRAEEEARIRAEDRARVLHSPDLKLHGGGHISFHQFPDSTLKDLFMRTDWYWMFETENKCDVTAVRQFYANLDWTMRDGVLRTKVGGRDIELTKQQWGAAFQVNEEDTVNLFDEWSRSCLGETYYSMFARISEYDLDKVKLWKNVQNKVKHIDFLPIARFLIRILQHTVIGQDADTSTPLEFLIPMVYTLMYTNVRVSLSWIVMKRICQVRKNLFEKKGSRLILGPLITQVLAHHNLLPRNSRLVPVEFTDCSMARTFKDFYGEERDVGGVLVQGIGDSLTHKWESGYHMFGQPGYDAGLEIPIGDTHEYPVDSERVRRQSQATGGSGSGSGSGESDEMIQMLRQVQETQLAQGQTLTRLSEAQVETDRKVAEIHEMMRRMMFHTGLQ